MKPIAHFFKWLSRLALIVGIISGRLAAANGLVVYNNNDNGAGSLRQAIHDASTNDSITFSNSVTGSITLLSGAITIDKSLTITGPGASVLTISGGGSNCLLTREPYEDGAIFCLSVKSNTSHIRTSSGNDPACIF